MNGSELDKILTRNRKFRIKLLRIHGLTVLALLLTQIIIAVFNLLPKWTIGVLPMVVIVWGILVTIAFEIHHRRSQKEIDEYFDKAKNEKYIRSSLEE